MSTAFYKSAGAYSWTAPGTGSATISITSGGGGGAGIKAYSNRSSGGGGGGGGWAVVVASIASGQKHDLVVGAGGAGGTGTLLEDGDDGGQSSVYCKANGVNMTMDGGFGGYTAYGAVGNGGGGANNSTGADTWYPGGAGSYGTLTYLGGNYTVGGAGGGGAGDTGAGNKATNAGNYQLAIGGKAKLTYGGKGGSANGYAYKGQAVNGLAGAVYGAGGSGAAGYAFLTTVYGDGGNGAKGMIMIEYTTSGGDVAPLRRRLPRVNSLLNSCAQHVKGAWRWMIFLPVVFRFLNWLRPPDLSVQESTITGDNFLGVRRRLVFWRRRDPRRVTLPPCRRWAALTAPASPPAADVVEYAGPALARSQITGHTPVELLDISPAQDGSPLWQGL